MSLGLQKEGYLVYHGYQVTELCPHLPAFIKTILFVYVQYTACPKNLVCSFSFVSFYFAFQPVRNMKLAWWEITLISQMILPKDMWI